MTWYWWTHWFWITSLSGTINCLPFGSVDTSPSSNPNHNDNVYNKGEPLKFPIAVQSDSDDIFDGKELLEGKYQDNWSASSEQHKNLEKVAKHDINELEKNKTNFIKPTLVITNNNRVNNSLRVEINETTVQDRNSSTTIIDKISHGKMDSNQSVIYTTQPTSKPNASPKVEKITKLKNISITSQPPIPESHVNKQTNEMTTEPELVREEIEREMINVRGRPSNILAEFSETLKIANLTSASKNLLARSAIPISLDDVTNEDDLNSEALIIKRATILDAGAISGICLAVIALSCAVSATGIMLYRRRYINKPQTLSEPDSSGYIDDSTIRDNSDELYSLDNDSFLNSLEAMTIQNYWTDNVKHTKL